MADGSTPNPFAVTLDAADVALKSALLATYRTTTGNAAATQDDMFADVMEPGNKAKDAKSGQISGNTGLATLTWPAGFWVSEPSISINPGKASAGSGAISYTYTKTKTGDIWRANITFLLQPPTVTIVVLGTVPLWVNPGVVTFDYQAFEQTGV